MENITNFSFNTNVTQAVRNSSVENKSVDRTSTVRITYAYRTRIAVATLSGNSLGQTVHTYCAPVQQAAKLVAAFLRVAGVTAGLAESTGSLPPGLLL